MRAYRSSLTPDAKGSPQPSNFPAIATEIGGGGGEADGGCRGD